MLESYEKSLESIKAEVKGIVENILKANENFLDATLDDCSLEKFNLAKEYLKNLSSKVQSIDNQIIKILALYSPEARDLREVVSFFKIDNELIRASSNTRSLIRGFTENCKSVDEEIIREYVSPLQTSTIKALKFVLEMFETDDLDELKDIFHNVIVEEDKTDELYAMLEKKIIDSMVNESDFKKIHNMLRAFRRSEKIADRTISIANLLLYIQEGGTLKKA